MADQLAQDRNMVPDSRAEFEAHYEPRWGRHYLGWVESAGRYEWDATQEAWFVWTAATQRQQERIAELEADAARYKFATAYNAEGRLNFAAIYDAWDGDGSFTDQIDAAIARATHKEQT